MLCNEVSESSAGDINDDVDDEISNMDEQEDPSSSLEEGSGQIIRVTGSHIIPALSAVIYITYVSISKGI